MDNAKVLVLLLMEFLNLIFDAIVNRDGRLKIALKVLAKMIAWTEEYAWQEFVNAQKGIKENIAKTQHVLMNVMDTENVEILHVTVIWDLWELIVEFKNALKDVKMEVFVKMECAYVLQDSQGTIAPKNCV